MAYPDDQQLAAALRGYALWLRNHKANPRTYAVPTVPPEMLEQAADRIAIADEQLPHAKEG